MSSYSNFDQVILPQLPPNTICPKPSDEVTFRQYVMRLYEEIAFTVNSKDYNFFEIAIPGTPANTPINIPNMAMYGSFVVCVSGKDSTLPCSTWALNKSTSSAVGNIAVLGFQAGTGAWNTNVLTITSTATNFQIAHDRSGILGNFNIRIIGTQ